MNKLYLYILLIKTTTFLYVSPKFVEVREFSSHRNLTQVYYYDERALCSINIDKINMKQIVNATTIQELYGTNNFWGVTIAFRPVQAVDTATSTYTYVFNNHEWGDLALIYSIFKGEFYIDIPIHIVTPLKYICGSKHVFDYIRYSYPFINTASENCFAMEKYYNSSVSRNDMYGVRIVQEPTRVVLYEMYDDILVQKSFEMVKMFSRLIFDINNVNLSNLIYFHQPFLVIKECQEVIYRENVSSSLYPISRFNQKFGSKVAIHMNDLCGLVKRPGLYNVIFPDGVEMKNMILFPQPFGGLGKVKICFELTTQISMFTVGINHTLNLYAQTSDLLIQSRNRWDDFYMVSRPQELFINVIAEANCTLNIIGSVNEVERLIFSKNEKITLITNSVGIFGNVTLSDFAYYPLIMRNYILHSVFCLSEKAIDDVYYIAPNFSYTIQRDIALCHI